jgi:LacI family transcriptional regulator
MPKEKKTASSKSAKRKTTPRPDVARQIRRRRDPVTVVLGMGPNRWILEEAHKRGWRLLNLWLHGLQLSSGIVPRGALVDLLPDHERVQQLREQGIAVVRLGNLPHPDDAVVPAVLPDLRTEGRLADEYFFHRGFRQVGYLGNDPWGDCKDLFEGLRDRAKELGMDCHLHRRTGRAHGESKSAHFDRSMRGTMAWLDKLPKPIGFLSSTDWIAAQICIWAAEQGFNVPADIAVLSRGKDPEWCQCSIPTISSFERNDEGQARAACDLLARMMAGEAAPTEPVMIPPKGIITRASTDILAVDNPMVARALVFMWAHLDLDLSVDDIAREVSISRRPLERAFRACLDRGINAELQRKRLDVFREKLLSTDLPIADLAPMAGFRTMVHLRRSFRSAYGMSAREYRAWGGNID